MDRSSYQASEVVLGFLDKVQQACLLLLLLCLGYELFLLLLT